MVDSLGHDPQLRRRHVGRRSTRPLQILEPRPATRSDRMTRPTAVSAVSGKQLEQFHQCAICAVLVSKPRQSVSPFSTAQGAIETDDDIRKGRQRARPRKEQKQNILFMSSPQAAHIRGNGPLSLAAPTGTAVRLGELRLAARPRNSGVA